MPTVVMLAANCAAVNRTRLVKTDARASSAPTSAQDDRHQQLGQQIRASRYVTRASIAQTLFELERDTHSEAEQRRTDDAHHQEPGEKERDLEACLRPTKRCRFHRATRRTNTSRSG